MNSTIIYFPADVRIKDVMAVIGILCGCEKTKVHLDGRDGWFTRVGDSPNVSVSNTPTPDYVTICTGPSINGERFRGGYFFESRNSGRELHCDRDPFCHIVGIRLIQFFGGQIDFDDCDGCDCDYECPKPRKKNNPSGGESWQAFQKDLMNLLPIREEDLDKDVVHLVKNMVKISVT